MELTHRILLSATSAAALFVGGLLTNYGGMTVAAVTLAALGTFALGILAATKA